jgi:hypothetical protein
LRKEGNEVNHQFNHLLYEIKLQSLRCFFPRPKDIRYWDYEIVSLLWSISEVYTDIVCFTGDGYAYTHARALHLAIYKLENIFSRQLTFALVNPMMIKTCGILPF